MSEVEYYGLNGSQTVALYEASLSLHKEVIQIPFMFRFYKVLDYDILKKAFNMSVARLDSLRSRYKKVNGRKMQYFLEPYEEKNIKELDFYGRTFEEEDAEIRKLASKPLKYKKGEAYRYYIVRMHNGNTGLFFIFNHMNLDATGIFTFLADYIACYRNISEGRELPPAPASFRESVIKELPRFNDPERIRKSEEFITGMLQKRGEPHFTCFSGPKHLEQFRKKKKNPDLEYTLLHFLNNKTRQRRFGSSVEETEKIMGFAGEKGVSLFVLFKVAWWVSLSKLNDNTDRIEWLTLCHGRATKLDAQCAGTKAQSMIEYPDMNYEMKIGDAFKHLTEMQSAVYAHFGNEDQKNETTVKRALGYKDMCLNIWYSGIYSYIPPMYKIEPGWEIDAEWISTGRFPLPAYVSLQHSMKDNSIEISYDCQIVTTSEDDIKNFHEMTFRALDIIISNPDLTLGEVVAEI